MNYWLVKTEPGDYSWQDLVKDGTTPWDGVRNYAARLHLKAMAVGDLAFVYHSVKEKRIMGIAKVTQTYFQDPTTDDDRWVAVQLDAYKPLDNPVTLAQIKAEPDLQDILLIKISRLSVMPVSENHFNKILTMQNPD